MASTPEGLYYFKNVLNEETYTKLLEWFEKNKDQESFKVSPNSWNSRRVIHYGYKYNYNNKDINEKVNEMPEIIQNVREHIQKYMGKCNPSMFNQCIINIYEPGQGIGSHVDDNRYGAVIVCFTMKNGREMEFNRGNEKYTLYTEPNSVYIMSKFSRYQWKHQMRHRKSDTVKGEKINRKECFSITFRILNP